jgi:hypothetical protein
MVLPCLAAPTNTSKNVLQSTKILKTASGRTTGSTLKAQAASIFTAPDQGPQDLSNTKFATSSLVNAWASPLPSQ